MRWLFKAAGQKVMSGLPGGRTANYLFQRHVSHTLPIDDTRLRRQFRRAASHFEAFREHVTMRTGSDAVLYEFGAGWDLAVPLAFYSLGVDRQIVVDREENACLDLVNDALMRLNARRARFERSLGVSLRPLGDELASLADLKGRLGIEYLAPRDARTQGFRRDRSSSSRARARSRTSPSRISSPFWSNAGGFCDRAGSSAAESTCATTTRISTTPCHRTTS